MKCGWKYCFDTSKKQGQSSLRKIVSVVTHRIMAVTAISLDTKKCLDVEILSDKCQQCLKWRKKQNDPKFSEWKANHQCKFNHTGSSGSMETTGALRIFERSCATRGLKYKDMLEDGDSSTYTAILESKPYGAECIPRKLEYSEHVQKRVRSRLWTLKSSSKAENSPTAKNIWQRSPNY